MESGLKKLLGPVEIGPLTLKNRMIQSPMWTRFASVEGEVTQQLIDYYTARAKSGVGMIIQEATGVDPRHVWEEPQIRIDDDKFIPGLHRLVESVHNTGALIVCQLHHAGMFGLNPVAPSDVPAWGVRTFVQPKMMTIEEIEEARELFIAAAVRAMEAGYDAVELHGSTSYLLEQFSSPHSNRRTDKYGGSVERRATLAREIIRGIRQKCGTTFPIGYTTVHDEHLPTGIKLEEAITFTKYLQREGIVYVHFLPGTYETFHYEAGRGTCQRQESGVFDIAKAFKEALKIKVLARTCGQNDPLVWEESLQANVADAVVIGRSMLCDAEVPRKVREGRIGDIRQCIKCNYCYESGVSKKFQLACALNPELGREREYAITPALQPKKVLVVGGGPGGMEAARVAALRGHQVTLMEKEKKLGGTMTVAALPIGKEILKTFYEWGERQCRQAGVKVELGKEVTPQVVKKLKPDVVIIATGSTPQVPEIPGVDRPQVVKAEDVLTGKAKVGKKVIVLGGRGQTGIETADFIVEKGLSKDVTIIMRSGVLAADMDQVNKAYLMQVVWNKLGIKVLFNTEIEEITKDGVLAMDRQWQRQQIKADTVVLARGYVSRKELHAALAGQVPELFALGDCVKPRQIRDAVHEAAYIARQI